MNRDYYKGNYVIAFYDMDDNLVEIFDNIKDILIYLGKEINRKNYQYYVLLLYNALQKNKSNITKMLGKKMKVFLIDTNELDD